MDKASQELAREVSDNIPESYLALGDHSGFPYAITYHLKNGRHLKKEKVPDQLGLTP